MAEYEMERFGNKNYIEYSQIRNLTFPPHFHRCLEFIYLFEGGVDIQYHGLSHHLCEGDAALFLPNEIHAFHTQQTSGFVSLIFPPDRVAPFLDRIGGKRTASSPRFTLKERFLPDALMNLDIEAMDTFRINGILFLLCGNYLEQARLVETTVGNDSLMHRIIDYIGRNSTSDIGLKTMAEALGYDPSYLSRYISKHMQTTFLQYLTMLRLTHAARLLQSDLKITDAALQAGFSCVRTFNEAFKKSYGVSPGTYRDRQRQVPAADQSD